MSLSTANAFAALQKTSKKDKDKEKKKKAKKSSKSEKHEELENAIFNQPSITVSNWADCDDEDEDEHDMLPLPSFGEVCPQVPCAQDSHV